VIKPLVSEIIFRRKMLSDTCPPAGQTCHCEGAQRLWQSLWEKGRLRNEIATSAHGLLAMTPFLQAVIGKERSDCGNLFGKKVV
jgi:hypothetical protein